ncbi:SURF1 family protein [Aeromicrobium sp.]|uniref:SURF1 family protein n=1 Tax=Aeromicrobium sp. TaxID=1871063 RepID=UPI003D6C35EF
MSSSKRLRLWLRPGLLGLHAFAVVAVGVCVVAGLWQLGLYDSRQDVERAGQRSATPVALTEVWGPDEPFEARLENRRVRVEGRFAPASEQVWVVGREHDGRRGAWLVALVVVEGTDAALPVVRGWVPQVADLPPVPDGDVTLDAVLQASEVSGEPFDERDRTIGTLSIPALTNVVPGDLYSGYAIGVSGSVTGGLTPVQPPSPDVAWTVGLRNLAYALQWWVFGAFAVFMWWRMATENVASREAEGAAGNVTP